MTLAVDRAVNLQHKQKLSGTRTRKFRSTSLRWSRGEPLDIQQTDITIQVASPICWIIYNGNHWSPEEQRPSLP